MATEAQMKNGLTILLAALTGKDQKPPGWFDLHELRRIFRLLTLNATSNLAKRLFDRGYMERQVIHTLHENGKHGLAYIYRPSRRFTDPLVARQAMQSEGIDRIPKGWVSMRDYANRIGLTIQAVHLMAQRHKLKPRMFRVAANIGCTKPAQHFRKADLDRLHKPRRR
jgi:hypothetical protein